MQIKISVIIPVYNAEKFLNFCIESLVKQSQRYCEFIFINDGSTDNSNEILKNYQKIDERIILVDQNNSGVSNARNNGLKIARGEYISFVDADDYLNYDFLLKLYEIAFQSNADIVISNFITEQDGRWKISKSIFPVNQIFEKEYIHQNICTFLIKNDSLNSCCTKLFKKDFIKINDIEFPVDKKNSEDAFFTLKAFSIANKVIFTDYSGYYYREVTGSASRNILQKDYFTNAIEIYSLNYKELFNLNIEDDTIKVLKSIRFIDSIIALIHIYFNSSYCISFSNKYKYVKSMIINPIVKQVIYDNWSVLNRDANRYRRLFLICIKCQSMFGIVLTSFYSNYRNRNIS